ncbi:SubName: Full=Uncharacterized protein {ECO:0000313/EMBL:CCA71988.1} [Serendipita indica DSM 11827]|nr:SubName: Full=Uncharacterized protein {ECO:0000313/EMBL:CCA71988.1} [Serendipita indica DSM 11827]
MPGGVTSYQDLQTSNGAFANDGGPWMVEVVKTPGAEITHIVSLAGCFQAPHRLLTRLLLHKCLIRTQSLWNATHLDYAWKYAPWWGSGKNEADSVLAIRSAVGDQQYVDTLKVGNWTLLQGLGQGWDGSFFSHNGTTGLVTNADKTTGYLQIAINITFSRQADEYINYYVKDTPSSTQNHTGTIVGVTLGAVSMIILAVIGFLIFRRRQKRQNRQANDDGNPSRRALSHPFDQQQNPLASVNKDSRFTSRPGVAMITPSSDQRSLLTSLSGSQNPDPQHAAHLPALTIPGPSCMNGPHHLDNAYIAYTDDMPPAYASAQPLQSAVGGQGQTLPVTGGAGWANMSLAQFAQENRNAIPESLEAKLQRSGYVPANDPDALSKSQWRDVGVTKLELSRLSLYQRGLQAG